MSCVFVFGSLSLSGCYTQLSMFHPESETVEFQPYSVAKVRPNLTLYARDGAGTSLSYSSMYNRFYGGYGFSNYYNYYNPYYNGGYYNIIERDIFGNGYTVWIPVTKVKDKKPREWVIRGNTTNDSNYIPTSNLRITRSSNTSTNTKSSSSSNSNSGARVTRRN